jgi:hypothetical protein
MSLDLYRSKFARLTKEKANLEQDLASERKKFSQLQSQISSIKQSITKSTSSSIQQSKQRQVDSKQKDLAQCQKKIADLEARISAKVADISQTLKNLDKVEKQDQKKQDADGNRRRDEELRHARAVTRESERQVHLQKQISNSRLVIDLARLPETIKVLFVASNPRDQSQLRLDEEIRAITEKIRASDYRDSVQFVSRWAARPPDLLQALNEIKPHVVHFSGHGSINNELIFQADDGSTKLVSQKAIVTTMSTVADNIRLVVFNACSSQAQAEAVTQHVEAAIGMSYAIRDDAAIVFAAQLYSAIGFGRSVKQAFGQGISALLLEGIPEEDKPALFTQEGIDSEDIVLVRPIGL